MRAGRDRGCEGVLGGECAFGVRAGADEPAELLRAAAAAPASGRGSGGAVGEEGTTAATTIGDAQATGALEGGVGASGGEAGMFEELRARDIIPT